VSSDPGALRVVLVDDDDDQRLLVRRVFALAGLDDVHEAVDGDQALELAERVQPALIVLDLAMPGRSGIDILPQLQDVAPAARVVILSNVPRWRVGELTRRAGAVGFVQKRVPATRLVRAILVAAALTERIEEAASARFDPDSTAPRAARQFLKAVLADADEELIAKAELLTSELVTNAVIHASSAPRVDVQLDVETIRVSVYDDDPTLPRPKKPDIRRPGGLGIRLVDSVATTWGADPAADGKVIWFELERPS
jgi:DNA-binding NarL/FixJ family response regulator